MATLLTRVGREATSSAARATLGRSIKAEAPLHTIVALWRGARLSKNEHVRRPRVSGRGIHPERGLSRGAGQWLANARRRRRFHHPGGGGGPKARVLGLGASSRWRSPSSRRSSRCTGSSRSRITSAGPAAWWGFFVVLAGQLLVALVFAELASRWPYEGSLYQWSRRLIHETYGWFAGWAYMWTLMITMVAVAYGAAGFVPVVLGQRSVRARHPARGGPVLRALRHGHEHAPARTVLKVFMGASIAAEVIGSDRHRHGPAVLPQRAAALVALRKPRRGSRVRRLHLGRVLRRGGLHRLDLRRLRDRGVGGRGGARARAATCRRRSSCRSSSWRPSSPMRRLRSSSRSRTSEAVIAGEVVDPVADTISFQLGSGITKPLFVLFIVGFTASLLAIQTNCSRVMWAFARADVLPAARPLARCPRGAGCRGTRSSDRRNRRDSAHLDAVRGRLPDAGLDGHRRLLHLVRPARGGCRCSRASRAAGCRACGTSAAGACLVAVVASVWVGVRVLQHRLAAGRGRAVVPGLGRVPDDAGSSRRSAYSPT